MPMPNEIQQGVADAGGQPDAGAAPENPILDAVKTIGMYIAALSEQGDPAATELQNIMGEFVSVLRRKTGNGEGAMAPPTQQAPPQGAGGRVGMSQGQAPGGGRGVNPMLGNMGGGARPMRGQVAVI